MIHSMAIVGSQWGDEGKGKIVDWLSSTKIFWVLLGKLTKVRTTLYQIFIYNDVRKIYRGV